MLITETLKNQVISKQNKHKKVIIYFKIRFDLTRSKQFFFFMFKFSECIKSKKKKKKLTENEYHRLLNEQNN